MPPKKSKEQTFNLSAFASLTGDNSSSWAEEEESAFKTPAQGEFVTSAPRGGASWARGGAGGETGTWKSSTESAPVPDYPPFTARVGNVSYDVTESDLEQFFGSQHGLKVASVRLPRTADGQVRGSAYVDFADKSSLVAALALGGHEILDRKVSIQVAEQRSGGGSGGSGGFGGPELDWGRRAAPGEGFGSRAHDFGAPRAPVNPGEDRFSRFRRPHPAEPELDWSARSAAPAAGAGAQSLPPPRRAPREAEPELDWGARRAPPASGRIAHERIAHERSSHERAPRAAEPELDWSKRAAPPARHAQAPLASNRAPRQNAGPELDWSRKPRAAAAGGVPASAAPASSAVPAASAAAPRDENLKREQQRIADMTKGFKALQLDDEDDEDEPEETKPKEKTEAESIGVIQRAQREATTGGWEKA